MDNNYKKYLNSKEWKERRLQRLEIDGYKCACCGTDKNLNVHHLTYDMIGSEEMDDLITMCKDCHKSIHDRYGEGKQGWAACLSKGNMEIINAEFLQEFLGDFFGARGRVLSFLILNRSEWNIVIGSIKDISYCAKASLQSVTDTIKCLKAHNVVKRTTNALMFNPDFIKAKGDEGDGELQKKYATFDERATYKKYD